MTDKSRGGWPHPLVTEAINFAKTGGFRVNSKPPQEAAAGADQERWLALLEKKSHDREAHAGTVAAKLKQPLGWQTSARALKAVMDDPPLQSCLLKSCLARNSENLRTRTREMAAPCTCSKPNTLAHSRLTDAKPKKTQCAGASPKQGERPRGTSLQDDSSQTGTCTPRVPSCLIPFRHHSRTTPRTNPGAKCDRHCSARTSRLRARRKNLLDVQRQAAKVQLQIVSRLRRDRSESVRITPPLNMYL